MTLCWSHSTCCSNASPIASNPRRHPAAPNGKTSGTHESPQMGASDSDDTFWSKSQSPPQHASIPPTTSKWPDKPESQRPTSRARPAGRRSDEHHEETQVSHPPRQLSGSADSSVGSVNGRAKHCSLTGPRSRRMTARFRVGSRSLEALVTQISQRSPTNWSHATAARIMAANDGPTNNSRSNISTSPTASIGSTHQASMERYREFLA